MSYYRPIASQFAHSLPLFQNAGRFKNKKFHSQGGLLHINRPLRRLPPYSHPSSLPKVSGFCAQQPPLFLPSDAIRPKLRTSDFHEDHHRSSKTSTYPQDSSFSVDRRFPPMESVKKASASLHQLYDLPTCKARPHRELGQVSPSSFSHGHLSRGDVERFL